MNQSYVALPATLSLRLIRRYSIVTAPELKNDAKLQIQQRVMTIK
jgi:hypothetical protein